MFSAVVEMESTGSKDLKDKTATVARRYKLIHPPIKQKNKAKDKQENTFHLKFSLRHGNKLNNKMFFVPHAVGGEFDPRPSPLVAASCCG